MAADACDVKYRVADAEESGNALKCRTIYAACALAADAGARDDAVCGPIFGEAPCN